MTSDLNLSGYFITCSCCLDRVHLLACLVGVPREYDDAGRIEETDAKRFEIDGLDR